MDISDDPHFAGKAPLYQSAKATIGCQKVRQGEYVNIKFSHTAENETHWFLIIRTERGTLEHPVPYPHHHLEDFVL